MDKKIAFVVSNPTSKIKKNLGEKIGWADSVSVVSVLLSHCQLPALRI